MKDATNNGGTCGAVSAKQTDIGTIPAEWEDVRLGDFFKLSSGASRPTGTVKNRLPEYPYPVFGGNGILGYSEQYLIEDPVLVIGRVGAYCGNSYVSEPRSWISDNALYTKEIYKDFDFRFMCQFLNYQDLNRLKNLGGQPLINQSIVHDLKVALPPLPEQRTIAAILSKIQQAIEAQEKIIERTKELKKSLMAKLFTEGLHCEELKETEIGLMPKSWEVVQLGNVCEVCSGFAFKSEDYTAEGIPIIKIGNLQDGNVGLSSDQSCFPKEMYDDSLRKYVLSTGDVLIAMTGATTGKVALVSKELDGSLLNQRVGKFAVKDSGAFELSFGMQYFVTSAFQKQIRDNILQSAQGNVSPKSIERMLIPLPELSEQKDIANVFERLDSKLGTATRKRQVLQHLFKSMLHQLMTGTIRVNNIELTP